jgi:hypothetical protein
MVGRVNQLPVPITRYHSSPNTSFPVGRVRLLQQLDAIAIPTFAIPISAQSLQDEALQSQRQ